jgi:hypothetical protein
MSTFLARDVIGFGCGLWFFGYVLGFVFFGLVPPAQIGWYVMPFGIAATCLVLWKWVKTTTCAQTLQLAAGWTIIAIAGDYFGIVKLLAPVDGYYKPDVYLYYVLTFALPLAARLIRKTRTS